MSPHLQHPHNNAISLIPALIEINAVVLCSFKLIELEKDLNFYFVFEFLTFNKKYFCGVFNLKKNKKIVAYLVVLNFINTT